MKDFSETIMALLIGILLGFAVGAVARGVALNRQWRGQAIAHGAAQYNPTNGVFEWKALK